MPDDRDPNEEAMSWILRMAFSVIIFLLAFIAAVCTFFESHRR